MPERGMDPLRPPTAVVSMNPEGGSADQRVLLYDEEGTGVALEDATKGQLANALATIDGQMMFWSRFQQVVAEEAVKRMDGDLSWTIHAGGYVLSTKSPEAHSEWQTTMLGEALRRMVADGRITPEQERACWRVQEVRKVEPDARALDALSKLDPEIASEIRACKVAKQSARKVSVKAS